jgi:transposase-like protein
MSKRYTPEEKARILQTLYENCSNVARTSQQTGVPSRTLYTWWKEEQAKLPQLPQEKIELPPPLQQPIRFGDDPELEEWARQEASRADAIMDQVLDQLLDQVRVLSSRLSYNFDKAPPTSQMMALTRLLDRILKLDARKPRLEQKQRFTFIRYVDTDNTIHKTPPWYRWGGGSDADADQPDWDPITSRWRRKPADQPD